MLILDQILKVKSIWCLTHKMKICCERRKYKLLLLSPSNPFNAHIKEKYFQSKENYIKKIALEEVCKLMEKGMDFISIEENQNEFDIGLRYICFMLKRMMFNNEELTLLSRALYSFCDKFFNCTILEIFFMISVSNNDNIVINFIEKNNV